MTWGYSPNLEERSFIRLILEEALRLGLVDEVVPGDAVVARAIAWCNALLDLPRHAMTRTRTLARADLAHMLAGADVLRPEGLSDAWFDAQTQATLHALAERLQKN